MSGMWRLGGYSPRGVRECCCSCCSGCCSGVNNGEYSRPEPSETGHNPPLGIIRRSPPVCFLGTVLVSSRVRARARETDGRVENVCHRKHGERPAVGPGMVHLGAESAERDTPMRTLRDTRRA